jgi:hypothetical protein
LQQLEPRSTRWVLLRAFISEEEGEHPTRAAEVYDRVLKRPPVRADRAELTYALEMAMDFFARHKRRKRCDADCIRRAYDANACTVELCEAYREASGQYVDDAFWFSVIVEADYRPGLLEVHEDSDNPSGPYTRFARDYQVVARNNDEAISLVMDFARQMGEHRTRSSARFVGSGSRSKNTYTRHLRSRAPTATSSRLVTTRSESARGTFQRPRAPRSAGSFIRPYRVTRSPSGTSAKSPAPPAPLVSVNVTSGATPSHCNQPTATVSLTVRRSRMPYLPQVS